MVLETKRLLHPENVLTLLMILMTFRREYSSSRRDGTPLTYQDMVQDPSLSEHILQDFSLTFEVKSHYLHSTSIRHEVAKIAS